MARRLLGIVEQHLQARGRCRGTACHARIESAMARPSGASGRERAGAVAERALTGHDDARRVAHDRGIRGHAHRLQRAGGLERLGDRAQIAEPRVDDGDHPVRVPFVDGTTPPTRGSMREASDVARANAFHSASRMWCAFCAVVQPQVQVALAAIGERLEELVRQLGVEAADPLAGDAVDAPDEARSPREVDDRLRQRLVHRHGALAVATDAALVAERLRERVAEHEPDVLDDVVGVDLDVAARDELQIVEPVAREGVEHVREERQLRVDRPRAGAVEIERDLDLRFGGVALDGDATHRSLYTIESRLECRIRALLRRHVRDTPGTSARGRAVARRGGRRPPSRRAPSAASRQ